MANGEILTLNRKDSETAIDEYVGKIQAQIDACV